MSEESHLLVEEHDGILTLTMNRPEARNALSPEMLVKLALFPLSSAPLHRDIANGLLSGYGYTASPVFSTLEKGLDGMAGVITGAVTDDEISKWHVKNATKLAGAWIGVPGINQAWASGEHLYDVIEEGEDFSAHSLLFGQKRD